LVPVLLSLVVAQSSDCATIITNCVPPYTSCLEGAGTDPGSLCNCVETYISCFGTSCTGGIDLSQYDGCSNGCFQASYNCGVTYASCIGTTQDSTHVCPCLGDFVNCVPNNCFGGDASVKSLYSAALQQFGCQIALPGWITRDIVFEVALDIVCEDPKFQTFLQDIETKVASYVPASWEGFINKVLNNCADTGKRSTGSTATVTATLTGDSNSTDAVTNSVATSMTNANVGSTSSGYNATVMAAAPNGGGGGLSGGAIAAIVLCVLGFFIFLAAVAFYYVKKSGDNEYA